MNHETSGPVEIATSYWEAESRRDTAAVLEHYNADATFRHPGGELVGHDQIASYYDGSAADYPGLEVNIGHSIVLGDEAAIEWEAILIDADGGRHPLRGVNVITVKNGKFQSVRAYFDPATLETTV